VLLIALAVALGVAVSSQERAVREASARAANRFDLVIGAPGSPTQLILTTVYLQPAALDLLPDGTLASVEREPAARVVAPIAVTDSYRGYVVVGTTSAFAAMSDIAEGRMFDSDHEVLIGSAVDMSLGQVFQPEHGSPHENVLESHEHAFEFRIVGRLRTTGTPWDRAIIAPIEAIWSMHAEGGASASPSHRVPAIVVKPRSVSDAYALRAKYRDKNSVAVFPAEVLTPLYRLLGDARTLIAWMTIAFQTLLLVAVLLIIIVVLSARRQSLGVLRALGAPPAFVFLVVWLQSSFLIAVGVLCGATLGIGLSLAVGNWLSLQTGLAIHASPGIKETWLLLALVIGGSLLAIIPSLTALRIPTYRLLRAE